MEFNLEELKVRLKTKVMAGVEDVQITLKATLFLCREIAILEKELEEKDKRIEHLKAQIGKHPPNTRKGQRGNAKWSIRVDEDRNRLFIELIGEFDYTVAKLSTNSILMVVPNVHKNFDVVFDFSKIESGFNKRFLFHFKKIMYSLKQIGIGRLVYVENKLIKDIRRMFEDKKRSVTDYQVYSVKTVEESFKTLDIDTRGLLKA